jgi:hypothetical protein
MEAVHSQVTKNCHYISRFLTRPWEVVDRQLDYYDFESKSFGRLSSKRLFAEDQINSSAVEIWLRDVLETPLAAARPKLVAAHPRALDDWCFFRAAVLMLWLQGARTQSVEDEDAKRELEWIAALSMPDLDGLVNEIRQDFEFRLVTTIAPDGMVAPIFYPSSGIFPVWHRDGGAVGGWHRGIGMPLDIHTVFVATGAQTHGEIDFSLWPASISNWSVGTSASRRVVIPPPSLTVHKKTSLQDAILEIRGMNDEVNNCVRRAIVIARIGAS